MTPDQYVLENHPNLDLVNETTISPNCDPSIDKSCGTDIKDLSTPIIAETLVAVVKEDSPVQKKKTCCQKIKSFITPENALKAAIGTAIIGLVYVIAKK